MAKLSNKEQQYKEGELIKAFGLTRLEPHQPTNLMQEWLNVAIQLNVTEQVVFDKILQKVNEKIVAWHEEDLKMRFLAFVLELGEITETKVATPYFERVISATVDGKFLKTKTDFMVAKGILDIPDTPYFHFQEWKRHKDPNGDPVAQLLEAFLIAQETNKNGLPIYGATVTGKFWDFYIMEHRTYSVSKSFDCTDREDLMKIIAILRKFTEILENRLVKV